MPASRGARYACAWPAAGCWVRQTIVADAVAKGEAIEAYFEGTQRETKAIVDQINGEIGELTAQIEAKKKSVQERMTFQDAVNRRCQAEMEEYADLVRFLASNDPGSQPRSS